MQGVTTNQEESTTLFEKSVFFAIIILVATVEQNNSKLIDGFNNLKKYSKEGQNTTFALNSLLDETFRSVFHNF